MGGGIRIATEVIQAVPPCNILASRKVSFADKITHTLSGVIFDDKSDERGSIEMEVNGNRRVRRGPGGVAVEGTSSSSTTAIAVGMISWAFARDLGRMLGYAGRRLGMYISHESKFRS